MKQWLVRIGLALLALCLAAYLIVPNWILAKPREALIEAVRQELGQGPLHIGTVLPHKIDFEIVLTEFPHDLAADAAGWEHIGNDPILSAP